MCAAHGARHALAGARELPISQTGHHRQRPQRSVLALAIAILAARKRPFRGLLRLRVLARAELVKIDGRTLTFSIVAEDDRERIGEGTHERLIINVERFDQRMQKKLAR